jgi:hypothetical protein
MGQQAAEQERRFASMSGNPLENLGRRCARHSGKVQVRCVLGRGEWQALPGQRGTFLVRQKKNPTGNFPNINRKHHFSLNIPRDPYHANMRNLARALCLTPGCIRLASDYAKNLSPNTTSWTPNRPRCWNCSRGGASEGLQTKSNGKRNVYATHNVEGNFANDSQIRKS